MWEISSTAEENRTAGVEAPVESPVLVLVAVTSRWEGRRCCASLVREGLCEVFAVAASELVSVMMKGVKIMVKMP